MALPSPRPRSRSPSPGDGSALLLRPPIKSLRRSNQLGVLKMVAVSQRLHLKTDGFGIGTVYFAMYLLSTATSIETNSLPVVEPYYLSLFGHHSGLSTIAIMTNIAFAVGKPPMSKIMDVFGRAEGVFLASVLCLIGALLTSSATGLAQYGTARMAAALGSQGLQLAQMVIVADTTSLTSRGLYTSTITSPWIFTTWIGPIIGARFASLGEVGYRTIYLVFGVLVPIFSSGLALVLWWEWKMVKADHVAQLVARVESSSFLGNHSLSPHPSTSSETPHSPSSAQNANLLPRPYSAHSLHSGSLTPASSRLPLSDLVEWSNHRMHAPLQLFKTAWVQLDLVGIVLLTIGCCGILLPLTWAIDQNKSWFDGRRVSCLGVGFLSLVIFKRYETWIYSKNHDEQGHQNSFNPILPMRLLSNRTVLLGSGLGFWHFACQYIYESYFTSFLQVARYTTPRGAQYIQESYIFTACISAIVCGLLCKWTKRYKVWVVVGTLLHAVGAVMMVRSRKLDNPMYEIVASQIVSGFGGGFTTLGAQLGVQSVVLHQDVGISTAVFLTITQVGGAVGSSVAGSMWNWRLRSSLRNNLGLVSGAGGTVDDGLSDEERIEKIIGDLVYCLKSHGTLRELINASYVEVQSLLNWLSLVALIPCLICGLMMENVDLGEEEDKREDEDRASRLGGRCDVAAEEQCDVVLVDEAQVDDHLNGDGPIHSETPGDPKKMRCRFG